MFTKQGIKPIAREQLLEKISKGFHIPVGNITNDTLLIPHDPESFVFSCCALTGQVIHYKHGKFTVGDLLRQTYGSGIQKSTI